MGTDEPLALRFDELCGPLAAADDDDCCPDSGSSRSRFDDDEEEETTLRGLLRDCLRGRKDRGGDAGRAAGGDRDRDDLRPVEPEGIEARRLFCLTEARSGGGSARKGYEWDVGSVEAEEDEGKGPSDWSIGAAASLDGRLGRDEEGVRDLRGEDRRGWAEAVDGTRRGRLDVREGEADRRGCDDSWRGSWPCDAMPSCRGCW